MSQTLILGANGTVGSSLTQLLTARGVKVLKATSKTPKSGERHLDLLTQKGLSDAFIDVDRAFLLSPPGHVNQDELLLPVINQARISGVKKIVLMTAMGVDANEAAPLRIVERSLERSGIAYNIIRPNWFMQNFNTYWIHGINEFGQILLPTGNAKGSFIDARDIAATAASLLTSSKFDNQAFDLTGPRALDHHEVAKILSRVSHRPIAYQDITPAQMREGLIAAGLPIPYSEFMLTILE
ncbi:MAG: NAD(P)H-binding protein, partial [Proteobacteria bacterium]|nr:NAD(P)H-binding protein [Pseudomonadota bacterium]